jgi:hypothetical protein
MKSESPYKECETCKEIADCPHSDVEPNGFSTPMPPECCPKPIEIMNATLKKRKIKNSKYGIS